MSGYTRPNSVNCFLWDSILSMGWSGLCGFCAVVIGMGLIRGFRLNVRRMAMAMTWDISGVGGILHNGDDAERAVVCNIGASQAQGFSVKW